MSTVFAVSFFHFFLIALLGIYLSNRSYVLGHLYKIKYKHPVKKLNSEAGVHHWVDGMEITQEFEAA